jgi:hypothetical protein
MGIEEAPEKVKSDRERQRRNQKTESQILADKIKGDAEASKLDKTLNEDLVLPSRTIVNKGSDGNLVESREISLPDDNDFFERREREFPAITALDMDSQLQKQLRHPQAVSSNINHSAKLDSIAQELGSRVMAAGFGAARNMNVDVANKADWHLRTAIGLLAAHRYDHVNNDPMKALDKLQRAGDHLVEAANTVNGDKGSETGILKDSWKTSSVSAKTGGILTEPWAPVMETSLEGMHRTVQATINSYVNHIQKERNPVYQKLLHQFPERLADRKYSLTRKTAAYRPQGTDAPWNVSESRTSRSGGGQPRMSEPTVNVDENSMAAARASTPKTLHELLGITEGNKIPLIGGTGLPSFWAPGTKPSGIPEKVKTAGAHQNNIRRATSHWFNNNEGTDEEARAGVGDPYKYLKANKLHVETGEMSTDDNGNPTEGTLETMAAQVGLKRPSSALKSAVGEAARSTIRRQQARAAGEPFDFKANWGAGEVGVKEITNAEDKSVSTEIVPPTGKRAAEREFTNAEINEANRSRTASRIATAALKNPETLSLNSEGEGNTVKRRTGNFAIGSIK